MKSSDKTSSTPLVSTQAVFRTLWQGIKPDRWLFLVCILGFVGGNILHVLVPLLYKQFFDTLSLDMSKDVLVPELSRIVIVIAIINAAAWILFRGSTFATNAFESGVIARLKQICFDYTLHHSYSFFANTFTGSLVQKINRFARAFESLADSLLFNVIPLSINIIGTITVVYLTKPLIAYVLVGWVGTFLLFNYLFSVWKLKHDVAAAAADSKTTGFLSDTLTNHLSVNLFTGIAFEKRGFRDVSNDQAKKNLFTWNLSSIVDSIQMGLMVAVEFFLFYYAVILWGRGAFTIGTFVLIQVYFLNLGNEMWGFSRLIRTVYQSLADSKEMVEVLTLPHDIRDIPSARELVVARGAIDFKNVSFNFNETRTVLNGINLSVKAGEKVALIGPSGAGKSTFVRLLLRLYSLTGGAILIDGQDISRVTQESLRKNISLVPQDPVLFHRTLMDNIRYGRHDATDEEVIAAAKLAHCDEFIDSLPLKYDTFVGERGIKLSGGERQRVAIARAILKNAPILILDEATSSLDSHSESLIQDALDKLMKGKTSIIIAHRLSTIRKMDRIVVIEGGVVVEEGSHEALLAQDNSLYKKLWSLQAGGFIKEEGSDAENTDTPEL